MASLRYEKVFSNFLGRIKDYDLMTQDSADVYRQMNEWLHKGAAKPYVRRIFDDFEFDDETQEIEFELTSETYDDDMDEEFVSDILAMCMVVEWIEPQVKKTSLMAQFFGGKEQKFYAQANQLSGLQALLNETRREVRRQLRDFGYIYNPYLSLEELEDVEV